MSCAGRNHLAKRSEATRDFTDTNWDGSIEENEQLAVVECDTGTGFLKVHTIAIGKEAAATAAKEEDSFLVSLPGKFHKLIWFLRGDIIVHDNETCIRKVSEEQLRRLSKAAGSIWEVALRIFSSRRQDTLLSHEQQEMMQQRHEMALNEKDSDAALAREQTQAVAKGNPNRASYRVATGFTSSDDDDDDDDDEEGEEQADEDASEDDE